MANSLQFFFYVRIFFFWLLSYRGQNNKPEYCVHDKLGRVKTEQIKYRLYETHNRDSLVTRSLGKTGTVNVGNPPPPPPTLFQSH